MFAQKSVNQQINNDIFINSTLMQIEKGIDLYINKFDINKDTSMKIQHDLMGLSINILLAHTITMQVQNVLLKSSQKQVIP